MNKNRTTSFVYMGDPQCSRLRGKANDYTRWGMLLRRALITGGSGGGHAAREKQLLVLGGDIVNRGEDLTAWEDFFEKEYAAAKATGMEVTDLEMATVPTGAAESTGLYAGRFIQPGNGPAGHERDFFSFDYGCCHFIFLSSEYMGYRSRSAVDYISSWIREDLAATTRPAAFVVMHHPVYTMGTSFDDDVRAAAMEKNYLPLLAECGVDCILCGHQHVYSRTERSAVTQIMGVSGTKYFDAFRKDNMAVVKEFVSVATLFEVDEETIRLKTIDADGNVLDEHAQQVKRPAKHYAEGSRMVHPEQDPLRPSNKEGITVRSGDRVVHFTDEELDGMEIVETEYSVMRRGRLKYEVKHGFKVSALLEAAQIDVQIDAQIDGDRPGRILLLTDSRGRQKALPLDQVLTGGRFRKAERSAGEEWECTRVSALLVAEGKQYRIVFGQQEPEEYNGRGWMEDIRQIEII